MARASRTFPARERRPINGVSLKKITFVVSSQGFNFFPSAMMDGYKVLKFSGESETMMFFAMGLCGVQVMQWMLMCATMAAGGGVRQSRRRVRAGQRRVLARPRPSRTARG